MIEGTCAYCGEGFVGMSKKRLYCGKTCASRANDARRKRTEADRCTILHTCPECSAEFRGRAGRTYCSLTCRSRAVARARADIKGEAHPRWKGGQQASKRRRIYGLEVEDYEALLAQQGGVCAICGSEPSGRGLVVDHDHGTGAIRGLLCSPCNTGLGHLKDSIGRLRAAIKYLEG